MKIFKVERGWPIQTVLFRITNSVFVHLIIKYKKLVSSKAVQIFKEERGWPIQTVLFRITNYVFVHIIIKYKN